MGKPRFTFLVAVHAFFMKDGKVLLLERANTGYMDGFYSLPAGHVDGNEKIWDAMKREILEEVGIRLNVVMEPAHIMHRITSSDERIDFFFVINEWNGDVQNSEPEKCAALEWFELDKLPQEKIIPYVYLALEHVLKKKVFSEFED